MTRQLRAFRLQPAAPATVLLLTTVAAVWLWAHEGHQPLPGKGARLDPRDPDVLAVTREARDALDVRTAELVEGPPDESILAYATLVAPWPQHAFATTRLGGRVERLLVRPGQTVRAGQVLAEVQSLELQDLQLQVLAAQNDLERSEKILTDLEQAVRRGAAPEQRLLEEQAKQAQARNALAVGRAKWLAAGLPAERLDALLRDGRPAPGLSLPVRSPVGGVVVHADVSAGRVVEPAEHLFEVVNLDRVWVRVGVLERDLPRVAVGQRVEVRLTALPGETFTGRVWAKGADLDPQTHQASAWAELQNPRGAEPRLLPGMTGQARVIVTRPAGGLAVPSQALVADGAERYVLVEQSATAGGSEYRRKNVVVGRPTPDAAEVRGGGLLPGDRVVTRGSHELSGLFVQGTLRLSPEAVSRIGLRVEPAGPRVVADVVELDGAVEVPPALRTAASSRLAGKLRAVHVGPGQAVRAGDVLAEVTSLEFQDLQLALLREHLDWQLAQESLRRLRAAAPSVPPRVVTEAEAAARAAFQRRENLRLKLVALGLTEAQLEEFLKEQRPIEALPVRSPIGGNLVRFDRVLGQVVRAEEPLFEVHDLAGGWLVAHVPERDVAKVRVGQRARVRLRADPAFRGEAVVARSGRVLGQDDHVLSVWLEPDVRALLATPLLGLGLAHPLGLTAWAGVLDPRPLPPHGMLAGLTLVLSEREAALAVPRGAVFHEGTRAFVFVRKAEGDFERQAVETGRADDRFVEITGGLRAGQEVASHGVEQLRAALAVVR